MKQMNKFTFYLLSFTWGLLFNLIGLIVAVVLLCTGHKPQKWGYCYYFEVGKNWGGVNFGMFFLTDKKSINSTKNHEHGHAIQNCYWGPLFLFVIGIPSMIRYWVRELKYKIRKPPKTGYGDIWFEGQATKWGDKLINNLNNTK